MSHHAQPQQPDQPHPYPPQPAPQIIYTRPLPYAPNTVAALVAGIIGAAIAPCAWVVPVVGVLAPLTAALSGHQALKVLQQRPATLTEQRSCLRQRSRHRCPVANYRGQRKQIRLAARAACAAPRPASS